MKRSKVIDKKNEVIRKNNLAPEDDGGILLHLIDLKTYFNLREGLLKAVDGVTFKIGKSATLGLVGESGCGKSVTAQAIMRIVPPTAILQGKILLYKNNKRSGPIDVAQLDPFGQEIRSLRGKDIAMIFQEPMISFSPFYTIGNQIMEAILLHRTRDRKEAKQIALDMLARVNIPNSAQRINEYPHLLSGGMIQRAMIAMALSCNPLLLIADEPTTALDVTVQAQVLDLMKKLQAEFGMAMLYISHDLGVIADIADDIAVMYLGKIVEYSKKMDIFYNAAHPYTRALLGSMPKLGKTSQKLLVSIRGTVPVPINLKKQCGFRSRCQQFKEDICEGEPELIEIEKGHLVRCSLYR